MRIGRERCFALWHSASKGKYLLDVPSVRDFPIPLGKLIDIIKLSCHLRCPPLCCCSVSKSNFLHVSMIWNFALCRERYYAPGKREMSVKLPKARMRSCSAIPGPSMSSMLSIAVRVMLPPLKVAWLESYCFLNSSICPFEFQNFST